MKVLDLFCGGGGFSLGFQNADFFVTGVDNNPFSENIFSLNDIGVFILKDLSFESVDGSFDVVIGGPPCRPWSSINVQKRGEIHPDYSLLERFFDHIHHIKPKLFLMENVPPLMNDETFTRLKNQIENEGYAITSQSINYKEYGSASNRRRLFTIGLRDFGQHPDEFFLRLKRLKNTLHTVGDAIQKFEHMPEGEIPDHVWPKLKTIEKYQEKGYYKTGKYGWVQLKYDDHAPSFGNIMKTYILHPMAGKENYPLRVISVRENLAIMGFPENYRFPEGMGIGMRYQMVANAVSPVVATKMAIVIRDMIK